jgi:hypothetical protein
MKTLNAKLRNGHAGGHVRDTFCAAIAAYCDWQEGEPEPRVAFEVNYEPIEIPISKACGIVWNCTDILPRSEYDQLIYCGIEPRTSTYAAAAHALLDAIKG